MASFCILQALLEDGVFQMNALQITHLGQCRQHIGKLVRQIDELHVRVSQRYESVFQATRSWGDEGDISHLIKTLRQCLVLKSDQNIRGMECKFFLGVQIADGFAVSVQYVSEWRAYVQIVHW